MSPRRRSVLACLFPLFMAGGCLSLGAGISGAPPQTERDRYAVHNLAAHSQTGCEFDYRIYQPVEATTTTHVIIGHGFLRDQDNMAGLSHALANHGIPVITLDFCNMRPWNGHHEKNALDMRHLASSLGLTDNIIYAGFSAGALAAILAADENTRAVLALDLVDQGDLALDAIQKLSIPLIGLSGPASGCNANNRSREIFSSRNDERLEKLGIVAGASHCEFESPSNWLCELACGDDDGKHTDTMQRANIIDKSLEALLPFLTPPNALQPPTGISTAAR